MAHEPRSRRRFFRWTLAALLALATGASWLVAIQPATAARPQSPVVAVIDSGVRPTHIEFDYRGHRHKNDQFVAWWDFTSERKSTVAHPRPGQRWDTAVRHPYDSHGHGTAVASMAAGRNRIAEKNPSAAPGFPLAIAKVANGDGEIEGDIGAAVRWATDTVGARVINISIGTIVPVPAFLGAEDLDAIEHAREKGVLVVVANGNGYLGAGVPGNPGWANLYGGSTDVFAVGADDIDGPFVNTDPEVAALFYNVTMASNESDHAYTRMSGTSFSSPYVAGVAARLLREARRYGHNPGPNDLETLVKYTARDTVMPPSFEGYGVVDGNTLAAAIPHARNGTLPARPSPDPNRAYVETVGGTMRDGWTNVIR